MSDRPKICMLIGGLSTAIAWAAVQPALSAQSLVTEVASPSVREQTSRLHSAPTTPAPTTSPQRIAPLPVRLRGPYYPPSLEAALPFPDPVFPEVVPDLHLVIRLGERRVYVYRGDDVERTYPIAVGRVGWETPTGEYEVMTMIDNPSWRNPFTGDVIGPGPSNPLGERWIGFWTDGENHIGFHGTPNEGSVGRAASHGCIRMYNRDVKELFEIVALGTPVIVQP